MARYKQCNYDQLKLLPISFSRQILPGTFEYTLSHLIDHELDLSNFERGPIFWTGKLMLIYQLVRRVHETHTPPYFHGRI